MKLFIKTLTTNLLFLSLFCCTIFAQTEYENKAKHIYQLTKYVEWNPTAAPLFIGVVGDTPVTPFLKKQASENSNVSIVEYNTIPDLLKENKQNP